MGQFQFYSLRILYNKYVLKRLLMVLGFVLLIAGAIFGANIFIERHKDKELIPTSSTSTTTASESTSVTPEPSFDKTAYSNSDPESIWVVVNKIRPLNPKDYAPSDLVSIGNGQKMRAEAANALDQLIDDAKSAGYTISPLSGYRSYSYQVTVYNREVSNYGQEVADTESARPGYSEHQTGFAVDVGGGGCNIDSCFGDKPEGKWVAANAYKYGFLVRYTTDKQDITGYRAEPWHIRYIGKALASEMHDQGVETLEEFFELPAAPSYL